MRATSKFLVDLARRWGSVPRSFDMDTLNTLFVGWVVFSVFVIVLVRYLYAKYIGDGGYELEPESVALVDGTSGVADKSVPPSCGTVDPSQIRRHAAIVPTRLPVPIRPPKTTGGDPDAVRWVNNVLGWFYEGGEGGEGAKIVRETWNDCLNDVTVSSALETGVLVEVLEVLPQTEPPICRNIITDCDSTDNVTITCNVDLTAYLRVQTTRTQKEVTTESEYACSITPLRGRLNIDVETYDCALMIQLAGWPEITLDTEGIRNNSTGMDEIQLQEVLREVLSSALRSVVLNLNFSEYSSFPRFKRSREAPDHVIPVGYDSLVSAAPEIRSDRDDSIAPQSHKVADVFRNPQPFSSSAIPIQSVQSVQSSNVFLRPYTPNLNESGSTDEEIEEAEESFTSMSWPSSITNTRESPPSRLQPAANHQDSMLTTSEESLVSRNVANYGSNPYRAREDSSDRLDSQSKLKSTPIAFGTERQSRNEDSRRNNLGSKSRTRSRSPVRRVVARDSVLGSNKVPRIEPRIMDDEELASGRISPVEISWKSYANKSSDEDDDPEYLKEILQQTSSLAGRASSFNSNSTQGGIMGLTGRKLLVKVVRATDVGIKKDIKGMFVDFEIDEPNQKYTTTVVQSSSPHWDQQFIFDLNEHTLELLFEIFESPGRRFLGLGIVGIEELMATPSQRQVIALQARPYEHDDISGTLTCEFMFLDKSGLTDVSHVTSSSTKQLNGSTVKTTTTIYAKEPNHLTDDLDEYQSDDVAEAALKDLEMRNHSNHAQTKSTLIIHSRKPMDNSDDGYYNSRPPIKVVPHPSPLTATFPPPAASKRSKHEFATKKDASTEPPPESLGRSRSRDKKLNFFGTLKKRFGRSKDRSRSMESCAQYPRDSSKSRDPLSGRSVSVERRSREPGVMKRFLTVPRLRMSSRTPGPGETGSARSSVSGFSGISSASNRTYFNEDSLLVVETREKSDYKYYLVPISIQKEGKFKKRGTKMHIYNEHRFVAKHLSGSTLCGVCEVTVGRSLGKQGYKCRDCGYITHKPCHVRVETSCSNSKVNSMDITYVRNKKTNFRSSELDRQKVV